MAGDLKAYLRRASGKSFDWTADHCIFFGADWIVEERGVDPAVSWRGLDWTDETASAFVAEAGGLVPLIDAALAPLGILRAPTAQQGDVGVVVIGGPDGPVEVCAVFCGARWASRSPGGVRIGRADPLAVWRVR